MPRVLLFLLACAMVPGPAAADLVPGVLSDFDDGTLKGWGSSRDNASNPGDYLVVMPAPRLAVRNDAFNGTISPLVTAISIDLRRPSGESDLTMRIVLMGPGFGNRWTSTVGQTLPGDGVWRTYEFSVLEEDLTRVLGSGSYAQLVDDLARLIVRFDTGAPSATGTSPASGTFEMDEVVALPEPGGSAPLALMLLLLRASRRCSRARERRGP